MLLGKILHFGHYSVDPVQAIRQHLQNLVQSGRFQEVDQLKQELNLTVLQQQQQQQQQQPKAQLGFPGEGTKK